MSENGQEELIIKMETTFIYGLKDPRSDMIRYVGKSDKPIVRLKHHIDNRNYLNTYKSCWIRGLVNNNIIPELEIIDEVPFKDWKDWEKHYIKLFKSFGAKLTNSTLGGDGNVLTEEIKKKISDAQKGEKAYMYGRKHTKEAIEKIRKASRERKFSKETKKKWSDYAKNRPKEHYDKIQKAKFIKVLQVNVNGEVIKEWSSIKSACGKLNLSHANIIACCRGRRKKSGGCLWKYKN